MQPRTADLVRLISPYGSQVLVTADKAKRLGPRWVPAEPVKRGPGRPKKK
jgi:hypothetical protein